MPPDASSCPPRLPCPCAPVPLCIGETGVIGQEHIKGTTHRIYAFGRPHQPKGRPHDICGGTSHPTDSGVGVAQGNESDGVNDGIRRQLGGTRIVGCLFGPACSEKIRHIVEAREVVLTKYDGVGNGGVFDQAGGTLNTLVPPLRKNDGSPHLAGPAMQLPPERHLSELLLQRLLHDGMY